ncbi:hypothetical protein NEMBOFW57_006057 [Staphylotrichum longicolle]|uniref:Uncharacterized protein n=1 Tax=Staphylotrichum longicolle TaxID=669026 RepID=A0AAD4I083_9PEZI|nr:hypothetical protein NEMBOFW57_006057 [Staphylotrichum longicolle]
MAPPFPAPPTGTPSAPIPADPSLWDRISTWVSEHKAVVYTIAGVAVVVTTAGAVYYVRNAPSDTTPRPSKKERRKRKQAEREAEAQKATASATPAEAAAALPPPRLPLSRHHCRHQSRPEYIKALNRRANADHLGKYSEALLDFTASCIIDGFRTSRAPRPSSACSRSSPRARPRNPRDQASRLPSSTFVGNYLQSFRTKPRPVGLEDSVELSEETGKGQLQKGLKALESKTGPGYEEAAEAFEKTLELDGLDEYEAYAYNLRGTFRCLKGKHGEALADLSKSIELDPEMTQSYIKRASMNLELGDPEKAEEDFAAALSKNAEDPDIFYHRAQLHFIKGEFAEAQKDYQKSIDLDRDFIFSHIQLGVTQYKMGSIASSMATFRRCMKNFEKTPDVYNYYGELLLDQGKYNEAIEKFDTAIELERETKPTCMNVLPLINKSLALFQWKQDFSEAEKLCEKALIIDPECDIAVATMAQLLLQQGKVTEALKYFERAAELARTEGELVNALSYAEATRTQIQVQEKYPQLASKLQGMGQGMVR